ncbi:MAG: T9SS type A sorting domain-containing protein [Bacteroidetes bacterium]|nr:T9SS type A sorting domain-containing protein [Bacteroidota bacterium]
MKKIYTFLTVSTLLFSAAAFGQSDRAKSTTRFTEAQKQEILAQVKSAPTSNTIKVGGGLGSCDSLKVDSVAGNGFHGNMFDIIVATNFTLETFSVSVDAGTWNFAIFYKLGTFLGSETSSAGWIFLDSANVVSTSTTAGVFTKVPVNLNMSMLAGTTYAFYVTGTNSGTPLNYTNGTTVGTVAASNSYFSVTEGNGGEYPFNVINSPRIFNGEVFFCGGISGIEDNNLSTFEVYPNPASQSVSVDLTAFNGEKVVVSVMNTLGQRLQSTAVVANGIQTLNIEGYASGMYFIQVEMNGKTSTSKLSIK